MTICKDPDCKKEASFNMEGKKPLLYCVTHKLKGMINVKHKKCEHGKRKSECKECGGVSICEHGKVKSQCKDCGGGSICEHGKVKAHCKECRGSAFCEHGRQKSQCKECGGASICSHGRIKSQCKDCGGSSICEHGKVKSHCRECGGSMFCEHGKRKSECKECGGVSICKHGKYKSTCRDCGGSAICEHGKYRRFCRDCGGSGLCKNDWCTTSANPKYDNYCLRCFMYTFPDKPVARNYKTKEAAVAEYIKAKYSQFEWITDKKVQDGCSRRRPDLLLDLGYQVIIIEIDENQHTDYDCSCENKRTMELSQDVGHRPIVFIRFNPDDYVDGDKKVTSCWGLNKLGICTVKKTKKKEWEERLNALSSQIDYWIDEKNKTDKTVEIIQLFYDR